MDPNQVQEIFRASPDLEGLDELSRGKLLLRGECRSFPPGKNIYTERASLDDSFCLLLSGTVLIERAWKVLAETSEHRIFGEMAYFTHRKERTATVRALTDPVVVLRFQLSVEELASRQFSELKKFLGVQAWERFVNSSQNSHG
ncbi:MAG TPA: cyclic nucleotide-binding domain-containing protein [Candidatus Saccharimonadales bacterium]|nr:cyclic nucleotide-binding domain-containing protein [Candidatus Saccharimonadales bacterium]